MCSGRLKEHRITGHRDELQEPKLRFQVHLMELTSEDKQSMQLNPKHLPKLTVSDQRSGEFHLPLDLHIVYEPSFVKFTIHQFTFFCQLPPAPRKRKTAPHSC